MILNICLSILIILIIIIFIFYSNKKKTIEGFDSQCPDILLQKGKHLVLLNTKVAKVPGVNPIVFNNLEDYTEYLEWQRYNGIRCPVLYLQQSYDIQGKLVYNKRNSPFIKEGGSPIISGLNLTNTNNKSLLLDSTRNNPPYNKNQYPGFDPQDQNVGLDTPLDNMFHQNIGGISPNPRDDNWGGAQYTEDLVKQGVYKDDNVKIMIPN